MNDFDVRYMGKIFALHNEMRLDSQDDNQTRLWHVMRSVVEWCDAQNPKVDFDALLADVRSDKENGQ